MRFKITKRKQRKNVSKTTRKPRIPSLLVDLATAKSIELEGGQEIKFRGNDWSLSANRNGNELWILSRKGRKVKTTDEKGELLYEKFTGFEADEFGKLVKISPKNMVAIGRAMAITYRSDKFSTKSSDYIHTFSKYPQVSVDSPRQPRVVVLRGGNIRVKSEGITG